MNATREQWRPVVGWENLYEVSDQGRVRSLDRMVPVGRHGKPTFRAGRVLKPSPGATEYPRVTLIDAASGLKRFANIHSLVLEAFIGPRPDGMECCHNDGDRSNARLSNLRWDTRSENTLDAVRQRTNHNAKKQTCPNGHLYDGIYHGKRGAARYCKRCTKARAQRRSRDLGSRTN
ncbi:NUMOD4 motif-containing HNH endonuclease [Mycobacteroides abscessus]|uniref:NUMOD4 motif-containing HNH endonuclease n=1 Tax=Mycobacteroides abscessus TaxID=36809 RepID=UPI0009C9038D|nr:NUMOD4 motif [Mycobacteroides abscessus subsp. abscessus]